MTEAVIELKNVCFYRGKRAIFEQLNLSIPAGEMIAVMGPSGTGKTTLMRLITGQLQPHRGEVIVFGQHLADLSRRQLMQLRRRMSMMFQSNALFSDLTLGENIAFPLREVLNLPPELIAIMVEMKLQTVGLGGAADLMPAQLSGGMARRAALARAMAMDPQLMIYDEPFTGQDPITLGVSSRLLRDFHQALGMTSLIVSHDVAEVSRIVDKILLLSGGNILAFDTPDVLYSSEDPLIAQFMHGKADGPIPFHYPAAEDYRSRLLGKESER